MASKRASQIRLGRAERRGRHLRVPLLIQSGSPVQAFDVDLQYDPTALSAPRVRTLPDAHGALVAVNDQVPGHIAIALASSHPLAVDRALVLEFDVQGRLPKATSVRIVDATVGND